MRTLPTAVIVVLIPIAEFVAIRRIGLSGGVGACLIFVTTFVLAVWAVKQEGRADQLKLQNAVAPFGFQAAGRDDVDLSIYPLRGDGSVETAARGELRGLTAWIFNYMIRDRADPELSRNIHQTVAAFCVEDANLPIFQIRPLHRSTSILDKDWNYYDGGWENSEDTICFPDALRFHRSFELMSSAEEGVRRHFNAQLLDTIATLNDGNCWVKGYSSTVLFFTPNGTLRPDELEAFARKGADVAHALFSSEHRATAAAGK